MRALGSERRPVSTEAEFWLAIRRALLMIARAIDKRFGTDKE